eukprot:1159374-Pelagomonas_calceolata.AAC.9
MEGDLAETFGVPGAYEDSLTGCSATDLSLHLWNMLAYNTPFAALRHEGASAAPPVLPQDQMTAAGATVSGYVKKVEAKQGMFVTLDRSHDARVKMCNLSDG